MTLDQEEENQIVSKSQRKRDAEALQQLGKRLTDYTDQQLQKLNLPESLSQAIHEFKRLPNSHGARRRQLQFIGRVMRDYDPKTIEASMHKLEQRQTNPALNSIADSWLEKIGKSGDQEIEQFLLEYPEADRQMLRQLHRNFTKSSTDKRVVQLNKLRQLITEIVENS